MNNSIGKNVHWTITDLITQKLKLNGVELNIYALINSFSQSQQSEFYIYKFIFKAINKLSFKDFKKSLASKL